MLRAVVCFKKQGHSKKSGSAVEVYMQRVYVLFPALTLFWKHGSLIQLHEVIKVNVSVVYLTVGQSDLFKVTLDGMVSERFLSCHAHVHM